MWSGIFKAFLNDELGAVTVDFVVLTSAIVGIAMAVVLVIYNGINSGTVNINEGIDDTLTQAATNNSTIVSGQ